MKRFKFVYKLLAFLLLFSLILPTGLAQAAPDAEEERTHGSLTVHKYEQEADGAEGEEGTGEDGQNVPGDAKPLEGVEFTITQTHSFDPSTDIWTEISNGEVFTGVTDASGQYTFYDLPLGRYNV